MELKKKFPVLSKSQIDKFLLFEKLFKNWNNKVNLISRKDTDFLFERHISYSLAITFFFKFKSKTKILDVGTGGGFPGIPLAIFFPEVEFTLIDRTEKKIKVIDSIKEDLKIKNIKTIVGDVKNLKSKFDFVLGRAVTKMEKFVPLVKKNILIQKDESGIIYLKGGELAYEEERFPNIRIYRLKNKFKSNFFETKKIIYIPQHDF
ncbi:MAG: 16S rRNA (guanine(527)-N(7))-methyltransferase RsmG [Flavobacteriaceae bacterium]|nr:16S rRNA (guanine(527)-N(7))-methyltransferase RsmG [Flavobacteriaceae bacterium]